MPGAWTWAFPGNLSLLGHITLWHITAEPCSLCCHSQLTLRNVGLEMLSDKNNLRFFLFICFFQFVNPHFVAETISSPWIASLIYYSYPPGHPFLSILLCIGDVSQLPICHRFNLTLTFVPWSVIKWLSDHTAGPLKFQGDVCQLGTACLAGPCLASSLSPTSELLLWSPSSPV